MKFIVNLTRNDSRKRQKCQKGHISALCPSSVQKLRNVLLEYLQWMRAMKKDHTFQVVHHHYHHQHQQHHYSIVFHHHGHHNSIVFHHHHYRWCFVVSSV